MTDAATTAAEALDAEVGRFLGDAETLWSRAYEEPGYRDLHVLAVSGEGRDRAVKVVRGWVNGRDAPAVSLDLDKPAQALTGRLDLERFPHAGEAAEGSLEDGLERAFAAEVGGHVVVLWKNVFEGEGSFVARNARVGEEERIVAGQARRSGDGFEVEVGYEGSLSELAPQQSSGMRR